MLKINKKVIVALATTFSLLSAFPTSANTLPREVVKQEEMGQFPNNLVYPWNISKSNGENFRCTGTFIGNNFFLSAGHCITDQKGNYTGKESAETETRGNSHPIKVTMKKSGLKKTPFKVMPGYSGYENLKNDVSVTSFSEKINLDTSGIKLKIYNNLHSLVGKTVTTVGYSHYLNGDFTKASGKILAVENDGTLTVDMYVAEHNSGSPVFLDGEIIGVLTANPNIPNCQNSPICSKSTVTPFTQEMKQKLFDPNEIPVTVVN